MSQTLLELPDQLSAEAPEPAVMLGSSDGRFSRELVALVLDAITPEAGFKQHALAELGSRPQAIAGYPELLAFFESVILELIRGGGDGLGFDPFDVREALGSYKQRVNENQDAYIKSSKPNPDAVYWPSLLRDPPRSIYDALPYVERLGLISKETPIGSAGSCFASEIALELQRRGFNYVVAETEEEDAHDGVFIAGFDPQRRHSRFSASYGTLFNTPSFRQLAEKAFGVRRPRRVLVPSQVTRSDGEVVPVWFDPFRENVAFHSVEAYEANYEKHLAAVRRVFMECEYFVITLGLNECWEFVPDGSVLSRNPTALDLYPLVRKRVLTVEENVANVQGMIDVVRAHNPDFKVIVTVSPVPFLATTRARECHVVTANGHSKAVLRVAAEEIVAANRGVTYFPSFEMVTTCIRDPFTEDQRHVNAAAISRVMELFDLMLVR